MPFLIVSVTRICKLYKSGYIYSFGKNKEQYMNRKTISGVLFSLTSALAWSSIYVAARYLMAGERPQIDPVSLSCLRFGLAGGILFVINLCTDRRQILGMGRRDLLKIAFLSLFALTGMSIGLLWGPQYTTATNAAMIFSMSPVIIMVLGIFIGERLTWQKISGIFFATIGCALLINVLNLNGIAYDSTQMKGDTIVLGAALCWAVGAVIAKKILTPGNDMAVTSWSMIFSSATLLLIAAFRYQSVVMPDNNSAWLVIGYIVLVPTTLGFWAWNAALSRVSLNVVSVMQYLSPVFTMILAFFLLGEKFTWMQLTGAVITLASVRLAAWKSA